MQIFFGQNSSHSSEMKMNKKTFIYVLLAALLCFSSGTRALTVDEILNANDCTKEFGNQLSIQLITFAAKMQSCYFLDIENMVKFDESNQVGIINALEKSTAVEIEKTFSTSSNKLSLEYGFVGLPEYFFYTKFAEKNPSCGSSDTLERLGETYDDCKLCKGTYFSTKDAASSKLLKTNESFKYDSKDDFFYKEDGFSLNTLIVEAFQLLWNCNNVDQQLVVTGYFDESTEKKFKATNVSGFEKICMKCEVKNCGVCTSNYAQCISCKEGYYMEKGVCNPCSSQNCANCTKNPSDTTTTCNVCKSGFYLLNNECVETCPPEYKTTKTQCLLCKPGQYIKGEACEDCSPFCLECSGPKESECKSCFDGFVFEYGKGCSVCPEGQQCGKNRCTSTQFRQLQYPYKCAECFQNCETCKGPLQNDCLTCKNNYSNVNGFCLNPSFKAKKFIDPRTKTEKECNFSCDECIDSTDLCTLCNPELNYFVAEGDRKRCYNRCPLYYKPKESTSGDFIECIKSEDYTEDLQKAAQLRTEAKNRCPKQQFWDIQKKICMKCTNNCISCNDGYSCIECEPGFYFNSKKQTCSACNPSCKQCKGPLFKDCITCSDTNQLFPDTQGVCNSRMSFTPVEANILSQNGLFENLSTCKAFYPSDTKQFYTKSFNPSYSTTDSKWASIGMMAQDKSCTFAEFQKRYKAITKNNYSCQDSEISQSTIKEKGEMVTVYATILANSGVKSNGDTINPQTLTEYALSNKLISSSYIYNPTLNFSCSQLQCNSQLDSFIENLNSSNANKATSIKKLRDIFIGSALDRKPLNCFAENQIVDSVAIDDIQTTMNNAQITLDQSTKQYFIASVCGQDAQGKPLKRSLLVQKYLGNAFIEVLNVNNPTSSQVERISLYGSSSEQNRYLKKCDTSIVNSFSSYIVTSVRVVQVEESERNVDKAQKRFQQYSDRANIQPFKSSKCTCPEAKEYIFNNENQGTQFITAISPKDKLLTKSLNAYDIKHILKKYQRDVDEMKKNNLSLTKIEAENIYKDYINESITYTKKCYGVKDTTPQCILNVLVDIFISSKSTCNSAKEITPLIEKANFAGLKDFISKSNWCTFQNERCLKAQQVIKSCM